MDTDGVKQFILRHADRVNAVEPLAAKFRVSSETLRKSFRKREGMPIGRFITISKVELAKRLLIESRGTIFEVCHAAGFRRVECGMNSFRRITGMTMGDYRRIYRGRSMRIVRRPDRSRWNPAESLIRNTVASICE